ncbi:MAG TPA: sialidase family protein, partial [Gemmataceae bacterium]
RGGPSDRPLAAKRATEEATVAVRANVHVSKDRAAFPHQEVTLAADPKTPGRLLAGSMINYEEGSHRARTVAYASDDGGRTWRLALDAKGHDFSGDPAAAFGPDGSAYFARLRADKFEPGRPGGSSFLDLFRSADGGKTWAPPVALEGDYDRQYLAVDCTGGRFHGRVYCDAVLDVETLNGGPVPALALLASRDGGRTYGRPVTRSVAPPADQLITSNAVVLTDGTVVVLYHLPFGGVRAAVPEGKPIPKEVEADVLGVVVSTDGGEMLTRPPGKPAAGRVASLSATERGGVPVLAAAPAGEFKDRLYAVWGDCGPGDKPYTVLFAWSGDKGATWSAPVVLSEQPGGKGYDAFMPSVAVNKVGVVGVSWYDTRLVKGDEPSAAERGWDVRFRASLDGGRTWQPSVRVTETTTLFTEQMKRKAPKDEHRYYHSPGETAGLAADADGVFFPLWIDNRTGLRQVWTAAVTVDPKK